VILLIQLGKGQWCGIFININEQPQLNRNIFPMHMQFCVLGLLNFSVSLDLFTSYAVRKRYNSFDRPFCQLIVKLVYILL